MWKALRILEVYQIDLFYILIEDEDLNDDYTYVTYNYTTTESPNIIVDLERLPDLSGSGSGDGETKSFRQWI